MGHEVDSEREPFFMARRVLPWLIVCASLLAAVRFALTHAYSQYDDAFIYFTYAKNAFAGCGLAFRCDGTPPVEGFTSPLYMAGLLGLRLLGEDLETSALVVNTLASALAIGLPAWTAARLCPDPRLGALSALCVLGTLGLDDFILLQSVTGLETALATALVAWFVHATLFGSAASFTASWLLCLLVRPECVVLSPLLFARPRAEWLRAACWALGALLVMSGLRWLYYGDVVPNTYRAKAGGTTEHVTLGAAYLLEVLREHVPLVLAPLALWLPQRRAVALLMAGASLWLLSFLRSGGDLFAHARLAMPLIPALTCLAVSGSLVLAARARYLVPALTLGFACWAGFVFHGHALAARHGFDNVERWTLVGKYLARAHPGVRIATVPVGAISYHSTSPVIDLVGLTSSEVARAGRSVPAGMLTRNWIGHERHNTEYVLSQAPALIVFGTKFGSAPLDDVRAMRAGFYAEWLLLQGAKTGKIPYDVYTPEVAPGLYWHMLRRSASSGARAEHRRAR